MSALEYYLSLIPRRTTNVHLVYPLGNRPSGFPTRDLNVSNVPRTEVLPSLHDPSGMGRRLTAPNLNNEGVRVLMKVRLFYPFVPKGDSSHIRYHGDSCTSIICLHSRRSYVLSLAAHPRSI